MDYDQESLESDLNKVFSKFDKTIDTNIYTRLMKARDDIIKHRDLVRFPLVKITIENNRVLMNDYMNDRLDFFALSKDVRLEYIIEQCNASLQWASENINQRIQSATLYFWINDTYPWFLGNVFKSMPVFCYIRTNYDGMPTNIPLWPDTVLHKMFIDTKYSRNVLAWDDMKRYIVKNLYAGPKENVIYFHGANTTRTNHNLRKMFADYNKPINGIRLKINVDNDFEPIYNWSRYEYLINLPGHYPWSNRLNFLPLLGCKIIHVDAALINLKVDNDWNRIIKSNKIPDKLNVDYRGYPYITFINYWLKDNSYISVNYEYYDVDYDADQELRQRAIKKLNYLSFLKLLEDIKNGLSMKLNTKEIQKRQLELTNGRLYHYMFRCIELSSKLKFR